MPMNRLHGCAALAIVAATAASAQVFHPDIPRTWDEGAVAAFHLPLSARDRTPRFITSSEYYKLKVRPVLRSYPVYVPGREPAGYFESLKQKEPEVVFDPATLHTEDDWIRAGELVFDAETDLTVPPPEARAALEEQTRQFMRWAAELAPAVHGDILPVARYVVVAKGVVQLNGGSCAGCHTRVMPDGSVAKGAQGNFPVDRFFAKLGEFARSHPEVIPGGLRTIRDADWALAGVPWVEPRAAFDRVSDDEWIRRKMAIPPGVHQRQGTTAAHPAHVPSLIGIKDIKYLDATGLVRHRSIGDLMRYAALNYGLDMVAHFGDFQPSPVMLGAQDGTRYSDEQLYALAMYLYSLKPPPNPHAFDAAARRGQIVFEQQGCGACHTAPLYTNNKLTPAAGFDIPADLLKSESILKVSVGTDPSLTMESRRGTGFYKVPSLRGVWYRNGFGHEGQAETLEEWFDAVRLRDDYVPKGFHLGPGPIKGHEFGLRLSPDDKRDLIAFLKTL